MHPCRSQNKINYLTDSEYDYTGVGLFVSFQPAEGISRNNIIEGSKRLILDGVSITSPELSNYWRHNPCDEVNARTFPLFLLD